MKRLTTRWIIAAAAVAVAAGSASAQMLKADIPFTFQVGNATMAPGTYSVSVNGNSSLRYLVLRNVDTHASALAQYSDGDVSRDWKARGTPMIRFACSGPRCSLLEMWAGFGGPALQFRGPKAAHDGETRIADIRMTSMKAD